MLCLIRLPRLSTAMFCFLNLFIRLLAHPTRPVVKKVGATVIYGCLILLVLNSLSSCTSRRTVNTKAKIPSSVASVIKEYKRIVITGSYNRWVSTGISLSPENQVLLLSLNIENNPYRNGKEIHMEGPALDVKIGPEGRVREALGLDFRNVFRADSSGELLFRIRDKRYFNMIRIILDIFVFLNADEAPITNALNQILFANSKEIQLSAHLHKILPPESNRSSIEDGIGGDHNCFKDDMVEQFYKSFKIEVRHTNRCRSLGI